jgi:glycosyltransferase involved in cell wall biosynthesis
MGEPLVSVIIPAFNAQDYVAETLDSILSQSYRNFEVIVVDDGSTDQTARIVKGYGSRVRYYYQSNSGGCAVPRNTGIKQSSGDYLCFMDADDLMVSDRISRQVDFMERLPHLGLVFCDYRNFTEKDIYPISHFQTCPHLWLLLKNRKEMVLEKPCACLAEENFGIAGSSLIRKSLLAFEADFEPTFKACEDFHLYYRLARHSDVGIINEVGMMRRLHGNNMSGDPVKMLSESIRVRTVLRDSEKDPLARSYLNRRISECRGDLARHYAEHGQIRTSLKYDVKVLTGPFYWPWFKRSLINIIRTVLLALGQRKLKS